jgi:hypothetical protein
VKGALTSLAASFVMLSASAFCQTSSMTLPSVVAAGSAFSIPTSGSGDGFLYIIGPSQAIKQPVHLGDPISFAAGDLHSAGTYLAILVTGSSTESQQFNVASADKIETLGFIAKPSRLPVGLHDGISGTVYVFDPYHNLILKPMPVTLQLSNGTGAVQSRTVTTRNGLAWSRMDSSEKEGAAKFIAKAGDITSTRIIAQVPGDPCSISITAQPDGGKVKVQTAPVHDCSGNAIPDGTIVTFTETVDGKQSTVDVPLKQGIARVDMPAYKGSRISVASGVVAGNEIVWEGGR